MPWCNKCGTHSIYIGECAQCGDPAQLAGKREAEIAELKLEVATLKALCNYCAIHRAAPGETCLGGPAHDKRACAARREP